MPEPELRPDGAALLLPESAPKRFVSYTQNGEDVTLYRALRGVERGFYVDGDTIEPVADSVTFTFYERGWRGTNLEPAPGAFDRLSAARPNDINMNVAAGDQDGITEFYLVEATAPNSQIPTYRVWEDLLLAADHRFVWFDGLNRFYVANDRSQLLASFVAPLNVFDNFVRHSEAVAQAQPTAPKSDLAELVAQLADLDACWIAESDLWQHERDTSLREWSAWQQERITWHKERSAGEQERQASEQRGEK